MSIELTIRCLESSESQDALSTFSRVLQALNSCEPIRGSWFKLNVEQARFDNEFSELETLSLIGAASAFENYLQLSTELRRFHGPWFLTTEGTMSLQGHNDQKRDWIISFSCWDHAFVGPRIARGHFLDIDISIEPFCLPSNRQPRLPDTVIQNNLDELQQLLNGVISTVKPDWLFVFVNDFAIDDPMNAHYGYFAGSNELIAALQYVYSNWIGTEKCEGRRDTNPSFDQSRKSKYACSLLRTSSGRIDMWNNLNELIQFAPDVTEADVEAAVCSGAFDIDYFGETLAGGFSVYDCPYLLNSYIDDFLLGVLRECKNRLSPSI